MKQAFTDQGNKAASASKKGDGLMPSRNGGSQVRKTGTAGFPIANQGNTAVRASNREDGTHMGGKVDGTGKQMSDGAGVGHGKSFGKKFGTSEMSQAMRKRQKASSYP